jgi:hypothetical protein
LLNSTIDRSKASGDGCTGRCVTFSSWCQNPLMVTICYYASKCWNIEKAQTPQRHL